MATIGSFTKAGDGFTGSVKTLSINAKASIKPADKTSDKAPDYRVYAGAIEFGAGWKKTSNEGRTLSLDQARRPELPGTDLRHPGRGRGRQPRAHLVPPQRRLTHRLARAPSHDGRGRRLRRDRHTHRAPAQNANRDTARNEDCDSAEWGTASPAKSMLAKNRMQSYPMRIRGLVSCYAANCRVARIGSFSTRHNELRLSPRGRLVPFSQV